MKKRSKPAPTPAPLPPVLAYDARVAASLKRLARLGVVQLSPAADGQAVTITRPRRRGRMGSGAGDKADAQAAEDTAAERGDVVGLGEPARYGTRAGIKLVDFAFGTGGGAPDCKPGEDPADPECDGEQVIVGVQLGGQTKRPPTAAFPPASTVDHSKEAAQVQADMAEAAKHTDAERDAEAHARQAAVWGDSTSTAPRSSALGAAIAGFALGAVVIGGITAGVSALAKSKHVGRNALIGAGVGGTLEAIFATLGRP